MDIKGKFDSETALFFPDSERKVRHVKLSEKMQIGDIMPTILGKIEDSVHQYDYHFCDVLSCKERCLTIPM